MSRPNRRHKDTVIEHSAPVLVLHLLRFTWNHHLQRPEKLQTRANFDVDLPPIGDTAPYDLRAVRNTVGDILDLQTVDTTPLMSELMIFSGTIATIPFNRVHVTSKKYSSLSLTCSFTSGGE